MFFETGLWVWPLWGRKSSVHSLGVCIYELVHHHIFTLLYLPSAGALPAKPDRHTHRGAILLLYHPISSHSFRYSA